ncbi:methyltransferase [Rhodococcus sp. IEGM 1307]|uniref:methyltransferase n=1 Tax=Rhodococcus sp. IEGM 1307 TaxID=3047091 RepID=UPI0024B8611C|nr:methyltransferase [Rhodococcus sp. IEGM 1307]MDI9975247.1 methyltransferase [Rhodococcus sp. IEGM 1307]
MTMTARTSAETDHDLPDPEPIMQLASGFMAAKHLFAASELGLFEALGEGPTDLHGLAARTGLTARATRISADAMVALGMLERRDEQYVNTETAAAFLAGGSPADLRPLLRFWDKISFPAWEDLADALARGPKRQIFDLDAAVQPIASIGIEAFSAGPSLALPDTVDLFGSHQLLDIGGGTGSWSIAVARHCPQLSATVFELPAVAQTAQDRITSVGLAGRIDVCAGDAMADPLPAGYDAFLVANLVHYWSPEQNYALLQRIRDVAAPGATLLIADFWTDPTHTQPVAAALMAGEFAVHLEHGDVYSVGEGIAWLQDTGWRYRDHRSLTGPMSVIVAETA